MWQELENLKKQLDEAFDNKNSIEISRIVKRMNSILFDIEFSEFQRVA